MGKDHSVLIKSLKFTAGIIIGLLLSLLIVAILDIILKYPNPFDAASANFWVIGAVIAVCILFSTWFVFRITSFTKIQTKGIDKLPTDISELIDNIVCNMRYRPSVRAEVRQELADHFTDAIAGCKDKGEREAVIREMVEDFGDVKLLGLLLRRAKRRCRPLWRTVAARCFQAIGIFVLFLIAHCVYLLFAEPVIRINYAQRMENLNRVVTDQSANAAVLYKKAFELYKAEPQIEDTEYQNVMPTETTDMPGMPGTGPILKDLTSGREKIDEFTAEELAMLRQWINDNQDALELFRAGSAKSNCWWDRGSEDIPMMIIPFDEIKPAKDMASLISWRSQLYAWEGKYKDAFDDLICCYHVGKHFKGPRSLIHQLVGNSIQAISVNTVLKIVEEHDIESAMLTKLQNDFEDLKTNDSYIINFQVERFFILDCIQRSYTDNGRGDGRVIPTKIVEMNHIISSPDGSDKAAFLESLAGIGFSLVSAGRRETEDEFEKIYADAERFADKTPWQLENENIDVSNDFDQWSEIKKVRLLMVRMLMPALARCNRIAHRSKADIEALITAIATLRCFKDKGQYPESLEFLVEEGFLAEVPIDPYSGQPFVYKITENGFTLYSLGENFTDNGGARGHSTWGDSDDTGDRVFWPMQ